MLTVFFIFLFQFLKTSNCNNFVKFSERCTSISPEDFDKLGKDSYKLWKRPTSFENGYPDTIYRDLRNDGEIFLYFAKFFGDGSWIPVETLYFVHKLEKAMKAGIHHQHFLNPNRTEIPNIDLDGETPDIFMRKLHAFCVDLVNERQKKNSNGNIYDQNFLSDDYISMNYQEILDVPIFSDELDKYEKFKNVKWFEEVLHDLRMQLKKTILILRRIDLITWISWKTLNEIHRFLICRQWPNVDGCPKVCDNKEKSCKLIPGSKKDTCVFREIHFQKNKNAVKPIMPGIFLGQKSCQCQKGFLWENQGIKISDGQCLVDVSKAPFNSLCDADSNPCSKLNTKSCEVSKTGKIVCNCKENFMPPTCHHLTDYCTYTGDSEEKPGSHFCGSTGICIPYIGKKSYRCKCDKGYANDPSILQPNCAMKNNPCLKVVCLNYGLCYTNGIRAICVCPSSWTGDDCGIPNSMWNSWSQWSACFPSCGANSRSNRKRICSFSRGKPCPGSHIQYRTCTDEQCVINGIWDNWSPWTECTHSCNGGRMARYRDCNYNGNFITNNTKLTKCVGPDSEIAYCNEHFCPAKLQGISIDSTDGIIPELEVDIQIKTFQKVTTVKDYFGKSFNEFLISLIAILFVIVIHLISLLLIFSFLRNLRNLRFEKIFKPEDIREMRLTIVELNKSDDANVTADFMKQLEKLITEEIENESSKSIKQETEELVVDNKSYYY